MSDDVLESLSVLSAAFVLSFALVTLEIAAAGLGLALPAVAPVAFYLGVAHGTAMALAFSVPAIMAVEIVLGRSGTALIVLPVLLLLVQQWRENGARDAVEGQAAIGALLGGLCAMAQLLVEHGSLLPPGFPLSFAHLLANGASGAATGALLVPAVVWGMDFLAARMDLPRYAEEKRETKRWQI